MPFGWTKPRCSAIGVDFGADSLKLLQVIPTDPPQLVAAAAAELPEEARQSPAARLAFFATALPELLKSQPFKGRAAMCSIPAYQTLAQHIQIARIEHEDFDAQIGLHLRQRLNVDPTRMVIRHFEVAQVGRDNNIKQEVIVLAASREAVMRHVELTQRAKLDVVGMHCEPVAIIRAFAHLFRGEESDRTICFIDLGAATTKVVITHGPEMVLAKTINAAGDHLTRHRAAADNCTFTEARQARIREALGGAAPAAPEGAAEAQQDAGTTTQTPGAGGSGATRTARASSGMAVLDAQLGANRTAPVRGPKPEQRQGPGGPRGADKGGATTEPASADTLDCLIDELQMSIRYHLSLFPGRNVEKLVFLGGEARQVSVCQKIARSLRIGAQLGDPLARLARVTGRGRVPGVDIEQPQPGWAVPMGLCLSPGDI